MRIIKRPATTIPKESAHGWLPAGATFDWHDHPGVEETMIVLKGSGEVSDADGTYTYNPGDVFIFPPDTQHKIHNPGPDEHEMIFVRITGK